jgi:hypothetical protein
MSLFYAKNSDEIECALHVFLHAKRNVRYLDLRSYVRMKCLRTVQVYADLVGDSFPRRFAFPCEFCRRFGDSYLVEIWGFAVRYLARTRIQDSLLRFRKIRYLGFRRIYT